jgi:hypothetical protein
MKKVVRLLAILIVLLAASAVPSSAIIPICSEFCSCESSCAWGCWDTATSSGTNCGDWGACSDRCGVDAFALSGLVPADGLLRVGVNRQRGDLQATTHDVRLPLSCRAARTSEESRP